MGDGSRGQAYDALINQKSNHNRKTAGPIFGDSAAFLSFSS